MISATINETVSHRPISYPLLARHIETGFIVLFTDGSTGTVVAVGNSDRKLGSHASYFTLKSSPNSWEVLPPSTELILKNEEQT